MEDRRSEGFLARLGFRQEHETWMMMSGLIALCALVAVGLLVLPAFGPQIAGITAVIVVLVILAVCYVVCVGSMANAGGPARRNDVRGG